MRLWTSRGNETSPAMPIHLPAKPGASQMSVMRSSLLGGLLGKSAA